MTTITAQTNAILTAEERKSLTSAWSRFYASKTADAADMLLYALLRGKPKRHGFTPITSKSKLDNGHFAWDGYLRAINKLYWLRTTPEFDRKLELLLPETRGERFEEIRNNLRQFIEQERAGA